MNEFDIIDLVYTHVAAADTGMIVYKDRSLPGEMRNHIVVSSLEYHDLDWNNVLPVNVNIFIVLTDNKMPKRSEMSAAVDKVRNELKKIKPIGGQYRSIDIDGSNRLTGAKEGFDCINIKVVIETEKNIEDYG